MPVGLGENAQGFLPVMVAGFRADLCGLCVKIPVSFSWGICTDSNRRCLSLWSLLLYTAAFASAKLSVAEIGLFADWFFRLYQCKGTHFKCLTN
jgi:hypothetical protein